jgi:two-component system chemotaxis response regulator CheY
VKREAPDEMRQTREASESRNERRFTLHERRFTFIELEDAMSKTALVVDDSPTMRQMVAFTLTNAGFKVVEAEDGKDAVNKVAAGPKMDIVVTDLNMPEMDGISLIKELRKMAAFKFTPILMLTTESAAEKKQAGKEAGATGWIVKPFNPEVMLKIIAKVLPA